jgi:rhodanese-related sulfurtransferase
MKEIVPQPAAGPAAIVRQAALLVAVGVAAGLGINAVRPDGIDLFRPAGASAAEGVCAPPSEGTAWITREQARGLIGAEGVTFIDARPESDFREAHIVGAYAIPFEEGDPISARTIAPLREVRTVITYCETTGDCACSVALAEKLLQEGLRDVRVLEGGWPGWSASGLPAEGGECQMCPDLDGPPHDEH